MSGVGISGYRSESGRLAQVCLARAFGREGVMVWSFLGGKQDVYQLFCASVRTGHDFDWEELIQQVAGGDQNLLDRYVDNARLVWRRFVCVDTWDCMIE